MLLAVLDRAQRGPEEVSIYLSTDGSACMPRLACKPVLRSGELVVAVFNADVKEEIMAWRVAQQVPGVRAADADRGRTGMRC